MNKYYFKSMVDKYKITLHSTENEEKGSVIERFHRTWNKNMSKQFTIENDTI